MKPFHFLILIAALSTVSTAALARDDRLTLPLKDALNTVEAKQHLDPGVRLYFGGQKHPPVVKNFGEWQTNKKTNAFNKSDKAACEHVFLSAVMELQTRARKEGANAVIGIISNYKNTPRSSQTHYTCGSGALIAGVALKGKVVLIGK